MVVEGCATDITSWPGCLIEAAAPTGGRDDLREIVYRQRRRVEDEVVQQRVVDIVTEVMPDEARPTLIDVVHSPSRCCQVDAVPHDDALDPILLRRHQSNGDTARPGEEELGTSSYQDHVTVQRCQAEHAAKVVLVAVATHDLRGRQLGEHLLDPGGLALVKQVEHCAVEVKRVGDQIDDLSVKNGPVQDFSDPMGESFATGARLSRDSHVRPEMVVRRVLEMVMIEGSVDPVFDPIPVEPMFGQLFNDFVS